MTTELQIQALGKPIYLGQLYNATTSTFINEGLFNPKLMELSEPEKTPEVNYTYEEVKSLQKRANTLKISVELSVSVMDGAVKVEGYGSYLNRKEDSSETHTISVTTRVRTKTERLDVVDNRKALRLTNDQVMEVGATHVVTAITYGGNIVGTFTEKKTISDHGEEIGGKLSIDILKGMGEFLEVSGEAKLKLEDKKKLEESDCQVRLLGDIHVESTLPVNSADMLTAVVKGADLVKDGVPCEVYLTSLKRYGARFKAVSLVEELDNTLLEEVLGVFDKFITLDLDRGHLRSQLDQKYSAYFPSLTAHCRDQARKVSDYLRDARSLLRTYLQDYRSRSKDGPNADFLYDVRRKYNDELLSYEADMGIYDDVIQSMKAAKNYQFEMIDVSTLKKLMNRADGATIALIIVPETVQTVNLLNIYRVLAEDIREWRKIEDSKHSKNTDDKANDTQDKTIYRSIYADPEIDGALALLDDSDSTLVTYLKSIREKNEPGFLTFGVGLNNLGELEWNSMNRDGWGVLSNKEEKWKYIGSVENKLRHGSGVVTYADESRYAGNWYKGRREGLGRLTNKNSAGNERVYIADIVRDDGVVVDTTMFHHDIPIKFASVALGWRDAVSIHVAKLADVFEWKNGERHEIVLYSNHHKIASVIANGSSLTADKTNSVWSLKEEGQKIIRVNVI